MVFEKLITLMFIFSHWELIATRMPQQTLCQTLILQHVIPKVAIYSSCPEEQRPIRMDLPYEVSSLRRRNRNFRRIMISNLKNIPITPRKRYSSFSFEYLNLSYTRTF